LYAHYIPHLLPPRRKKWRRDRAMNSGALTALGRPALGRPANGSQAGTGAFGTLRAHGLALPQGRGPRPAPWRPALRPQRQRTTPGAPLAQPADGWRRYPAPGGGGGGGGAGGEPLLQQPAHRWRGGADAAAAGGVPPPHPRATAAPALGAGASGDLSEPLLSPPGGGSALGSHSTLATATGAPGSYSPAEASADGGLAPPPPPPPPPPRGLGGAKQLLAQQLHSVQTLEPSLGSLEDYSGFDTLDDARADGSGGVGAGGVLHGKQASAATFEVLRVDALGQVRRVHVRRRDLLREHMLQPRDLRRVDPSVEVAKTSPSIAVKENVLLVNLGGVR
jgi:hypothetical protein